MFQIILLNKFLYLRLLNITNGELITHNECIAPKFGFHHVIIDLKIQHKLSYGKVCILYNKYNNVE